MGRRESDMLIGGTVTGAQAKQTLLEFGLSASHWAYSSEVEAAAIPLEPLVSAIERIRRRKESITIRSVNTSDRVTRGIRVQVKSYYVPEKSAPQNSAWFFAYEVKISNEGEESAQLLSRHWIISDASGSKQEVKGPGVVGKQPVLEPGKSFEYRSACPLPTEFGTMEGSYGMVDSEGNRFDVEIAPFSLSRPYAIN